MVSKNIREDKIIPDYVLEHDEILKVHFPEIACASPLASCVGMGIYDEISKSGYLVFTFGNNASYIEKTISLALGDFKDIKKLKVEVAGANRVHITDLENDDELDQVREDAWNELENLIYSYDFNKNNVKMHKLTKRGMSQSMYLDCAKGKIFVFSEQDESPMSKNNINLYFESEDYYE